jgi:hypothetical protein
LLANGIVEHWHFDVWEAIMKSCDGEEVHWPRTTHLVFWAERVTIQRSPGLSPYFMVHGIEPLFPFNLTEATFLVLIPDTYGIFTSALLAFCAHQLQSALKILNQSRNASSKATSHLSRSSKLSSQTGSRITTFNPVVWY